VPVVSSDRCTRQPARPPTPGPRPARPPAPGPPPTRTPADSHRADPRGAVGRQGEELAAAHLARLGFALLARNVRTRHGEIDLIAFDGAVLVFAEVKSQFVRGACPARLPGSHQREAPGTTPLEQAISGVSGRWCRTIATCPAAGTNGRSHRAESDAARRSARAPGHLTGHAAEGSDSPRLIPWTWWRADEND